MNNQSKGWMYLLGLVFTFTVHASNPASTDYVEAQIAKLTAEILQMLNAA